jgi:hypothetical protein
MHGLARCVVRGRISGMNTAKEEVGQREEKWPWNIERQRYTTG